MDNKCNRYCVYEHIRNDNNQCFYVGKGTINRAYSKSRNQHHNRIEKKYGMHVNIIKDGLTEDDAYELEHKTIQHYVFDLGFGIDILGYNNNPNENGHLTNQTFGGDGSKGMKHTEDWKIEHSQKMRGENNPAYGKNYWDTFSEEKKEKIKKRMSENNSGENNPMYGIIPKNRMDEKTYKKWIETRSTLSSGKNNPNYNNDTLKKKLIQHPELKKQYFSRPKGQNGRARKISVYDINGNFIKSFDCITNCIEWMKDKNNIQTHVNTMIAAISSAASNNKIYKGYKFKFD